MLCPQDSFGQLFDEHVLEDQSAGSFIESPLRYFINKNIKFIWNVDQFGQLQ